MIFRHLVPVFCREGIASPKRDIVACTISLIHTTILLYVHVHTDKTALTHNTCYLPTLGIVREHYTAM